MPKSQSTTHRTCTHCRKCLPLEDFSRNRADPLGHGYYCLACARLKSKEHYNKRKARNTPIENPERIFQACTICGDVLSMTEFRKDITRKNGYTTRCKPCTWKAQQENCNQGWLNEWKREQGCYVCGEAEPSCLDLHHIDATIKKAEGSYLKYLKNREVLLEELKNCAVLCANCHRKLHAGILKVRW